MRFVGCIVTIALVLSFARPACSPTYFYGATISSVREHTNKLTASRGNERKEIEVIATAYTPHDKGCTGITYTGKIATYGVVAVDPKIIPLHTKVYIPGYGYAVAEDVGGAIKGNRIDVCIPDKQKALEWGVRKITIEMVR